MKHLISTAKVAFYMMAALLTATAVLPSCEGNHPIEVIQTDYNYVINVDDIHIAEGVRAECVIRLAIAAKREEAVTVDYRVDGDPALRISMDGREIASGASVTFSSTGTMTLTLPELEEGTHVLHLTLTNQYGKSVSKDISFQVIRDKVWAKAVKAPASLRLEKGAVLDTTAAIEPSNADILEMGVLTTNDEVVKASLSGAGAQKVLRVEPVGDGSASLTLHHEDIDGVAATIAVEVYSYKIDGLPAEMNLTEGDAATLTLTVSPSATITVSSSDACLAVSSPTSTSGIWTLKASSPGTAILTAKAGRTEAVCRVTVNKKPETIALSPMSASIPYGQTKFFSVSASADFMADLSTNAASIVERTSTGVTIRNDNPLFEDTRATLTVTNIADQTKKAVADIVLEKKPETLTLEESLSEDGRSIWSVSGENKGWTVKSIPQGLGHEVVGSTVILTNNTYKAITGVMVVATKVQGVEASRNITVKGLPVVLSTLSADPSSFSIEVGKSVSVSLTAAFTDGARKDVTNEATWTQSSNLSRSGNSFTATDQGSAWIRATYGEKSVTIDGTATPKPVNLLSVEIDPTYFNALVGESRIFSVTAALSDGTRKDVTRDCEWNVSGSAQEVSKGYYKMTDVGDILVEATYTFNGTSMTARSRGTVTKPSGTVSGVSIDPKTATVMVGDAVTFTGTVRYTDGTTDAAGTFTVNPATVLSGADGSYVAIAEGSATVTYSYAGYSASAAVSVTKNGGGAGGGTLQQIALNNTQLTLYTGRQGSLTAVAKYSDGSAKDVTGTASWSSSNESVATVDAYGRVTAIKAGSAVVTATVSGLSGSCAITVEDELVLKGISLTPASLSATEGDGPKSISAKGYYSDGTSKDLTFLGTWSSSNPSVATVSGGVVTFGASGTASITCAYQDVTATAPVTVSKRQQITTKITMNTTSASLTVGETLQLDGTVYCEYPTATYSAKTVCDWSSSNSSVATVSRGLVTAKGAGTATITASNNGVQAQCVITVQAATVTRVDLEPSSDFSMEAGTDRQMYCYAVTSDGKRTDVTASANWTSTRTNVATVTSGIVSAKSVSETSSTTVTATYNGKSKSITVTVTPPASAKPKSLAISPASVSLAIGETRSYSATVTYQNNSTSTVTSATTFSTENSGVAYFNGTTLMAKAAGTTKVNASYTAGGVTVTATGSVTVEKAPEYRISVDKTDLYFKASDANANAKQTFVVTLTNVSSVNRSVEGNWFTYEVSSNGKTYTVYPNSANTENKQRTGKITLSDPSGKASSVSVNISQGANTDVAVTSIKLDRSSATIEAGATLTLNATLEPTNATDKNVSWETSNSAVATVSGGTVLGVSSGSATITARSHNGLKATCEVTVVKAVTGVKIYQGNEDKTGKEIRVPLKSSVSLTAKILPEDASNKKVTWSSSNSSIIEVDASGTVTAQKTQSATITVKTEDGNKTASVTVTGYQENYSIGVSATRLTWNYNDKSEKTINLTLTNVPSVIHTYNGKYFNVSTDSRTYVKVTPKIKNDNEDANESFFIKDENGNATAQQIDLVWSAKPASEPDAIELSIPNHSGPVKSGVIINATVKDQYKNVMPNAKVTWSSDPDGYVKITPGNTDTKTATLDAIATGSNIKIYATAGSITSSGYSINTEVDLESISFSNSNVSLYVGNTIKQTPSFSPSSGLSDNQKKVSWSSSNTSVATVSNDGTVTAKAEGTANITATSSYKSSVKGSYQVIVSQKASSVTIKDASGKTSGDYSTDYNGGSFSLSASLSPSSASPKKVKWSVSGSCISITNEEDLNCVFSINAVGTATVSAKWVGDESVVGSFQVTIKDNSQLLTFTKTNFDVIVGETITLGKVLAYQSNGYYYDETTISAYLSKHTNWSPVISSPGIIEFNQSNNTVKGINVGSADITLKNSSNPKQATSNSLCINVLALPTLNFESPINMKVNEEKTVSINFAGDAGSISWEASDNTVIQLSASSDTKSRTIKALKAGSTTVKLKKGSYVLNEFSVNIAGAPVISIPQQTYTLDVGSSISVTATVKNPDESVNENNMTWSIQGYGGMSNGIIAIAPNGNSVSVTGLASGTATVVVKSGSKTASFNVVVNNPEEPEWMCMGLNPEVSGTDISIIASFEHQSTGATKTEDVTKDVTIESVDKGLTVSKTSPTTTRYYLTVKATKDGTYQFTVRYRTEEIVITVTKSGSTYNIR